MTELRPKEKLEQMIDFFDRRGKERGYQIEMNIEPNEIKVKYKNGDTYPLLLFYKKIPLGNLIGSNWKKEDFIFYKDKKTFFRKMVEYNKGWRINKSLKFYSKKRINKILTLTIQERLALFEGDWDSIRNFNERDLRGKKLIYFQPKTQKLREDLRYFNKILPVELDYAHLEYGDREKDFAKSGLSKTYFFLNEKISN